VGVNSVHWAQELLKVTFNSILACDFIIIGIILLLLLFILQRMILSGYRIGYQK